MLPVNATAEQKALVYAEICREQERRSGYKMRGYFPETGPFSRQAYAKHMAFIEAGRLHRERLFMAANRIGKTDLGAYEVTCHLTGLYPEWWMGRKYSGPIKCWAAGNTNATVLEILQEKLFGVTVIADVSFGQLGTGMLPGHTIGHVTHKTGKPGAFETAWIKHVNGGSSVISLKSYEQGRKAFEGTAIDVIWLDEEPPEDVYTECLLRTMTTNGMILATFTPLQGRTPLILSFMNDKPTPTDPSQIERPSVELEA